VEQAFVKRRRGAYGGTAGQGRSPVGTWMQPPTEEFFTPVADMSAINIAGLGLNRYDHYMPNIVPIGRGVRTDNSGSARLTFDALDLYPVASPTQ
jgi:hypothetical protein